MERKHACDQCQYSANKLSNLKQHKERKHEGVKYPCDQCTYSATTFSNLKIHKQSQHEELDILVTSAIILRL